MLRCKRQHGLYWNPAHYYKIQSKCVVNMLQQFTYIFILCLLPIHHCLMSCVAINIDSYECCCLMIFIIQGMENAWSLAYLYMLMKMRKTGKYIKLWISPNRSNEDKCRGMVTNVHFHSFHILKCNSISVLSIYKCIKNRMLIVMWTGHFNIFKNKIYTFTVLNGLF